MGKIVAVFMEACPCQAKTIRTTSMAIAAKRLVGKLQKVMPT